MNRFGPEFDEGLIAKTSTKVSRPVKIALIIGAVVVIVATAIALLVVFMSNSPTVSVTPTVSSTPSPTVTPPVPSDAIQRYLPMVISIRESVVLSLDPDTYGVKNRHAALGLISRARPAPGHKTMGLNLVGDPYFQLIDVRALPTVTNLGVLKANTTFPAIVVLDFCLPTDTLVILLAYIVGADRKIRYLLRTLDTSDPNDIAPLADYSLPFEANQLQLNAEATMLFVKSRKVKNGITLVRIKKGNALVINPVPIVLDAASTWDITRITVSQNVVYIMAGEIYDASPNPAQSVTLIRTHLFMVDLSDPSPTIQTFSDVFGIYAVQEALVSEDQEFLFMACARHPFVALNLRTKEKITIDNGDEFRAMQLFNQEIHFGTAVGTDDTGTTMNLITFSSLPPFQKIKESGAISLGVVSDTFSLYWLFDVDDDA